MGKYTLTLNEYVNNKAILNCPEGVDINDYIESLTDAQIHAFAADLFPASYPFYDSTAGAKATWQNQFIDHFYFYEIGQETIGRFKWVLKCFLNEKMPYFADLYASKIATLAEALKNTDITTGENVKEDTSGGKNASGSRISSDNGNQTNTNVSERGGIGSSTSQSNTINNDTAYVNPINTATMEAQNRKNTVTGGNASQTSDTYDNSTDSGSVTSSNINKQTNTDTETNFNDKSLERTITEEGYRGIDKLKNTAEYRALILDMDCTIFDEVLKYGLFMKIW